MITLEEFKVSCIAYGNAGGVAHLLKSLDAPPVVYDYVFFNTDDGYFTKASVPGGALNDPVERLQRPPPGADAPPPPPAAGAPSAAEAPSAMDPATAAWHANPGAVGVQSTNPQGSAQSISDARRYGQTFGTKTSTGPGAHQFEYRMGEDDPHFPGQTIQPGFGQRAGAVVGSTAGKVAGAPASVGRWAKDKWGDIQDWRDVRRKKTQIADYASKLSDDQVKDMYQWMFPSPEEMAAGRDPKTTMDRSGPKSSRKRGMPVDAAGKRQEGPNDKLADLARRAGEAQEGGTQTMRQTHLDAMNDLDDDKREQFEELMQRHQQGDREAYRAAMNMLYPQKYAEIDPEFEERDDGEDDGTAERFSENKVPEPKVATAAQGKSRVVSPEDAKNEAEVQGGPNKPVKGDDLGDFTNVPDDVRDYKEPVETTSSTEVNPLPFNEAEGDGAEPTEWQHGFGGSSPWDISGTDKDHWDLSMYEDLATRRPTIRQAKRNEDGSIMVDDNNEPIMEDVKNPDRDSKARHHGGGIIGAHRSFRAKRDDGRPRATHVDKVRAIAQQNLGGKSMWVDPKTGQIDIPRTKKIWQDAEKQYKTARKEQALNWKESLPEDDERRATHRRGDDSGWKNVVTRGTSWDDYLAGMQVDDPLAWRSWRDEEDGMGEHGGLDPEVFASMSPRRQKAWMDAVEAEHAGVDGVRGGASFLQQMYPELHKLGPSAIKDALEAHQKDLEEKAKQENTVKVQRQKKIGAAGKKTGGEVKEGGGALSMEELKAQYEQSKKEGSKSESRYAEYNLGPDSEAVLDSMHDGTLAEKIFEDEALQALLKDVDFNADEDDEQQSDKRFQLEEAIQSSPAFVEVMEHIQSGLPKLPNEEKQKILEAWQQSIRDQQTKLFKKSLSPLDRAFGTFYGGVW